MALFDCTKISLTEGSKGENVKTLQTALKSLGMYTRQIDGDFGSYTKDGVIKFQSDNGLKADGWFGTESCKKLNKVMEGKTDGTSASSSNVASSYAFKRRVVTDTSPAYQKKESYRLTLFPDVVVLPSTELDDDGGVTKTGGSIETDTNFDCTKVSLKKGSTGEEVKKLQTVLKARGYYSRQIDGSFGVYTENGVKKLQEAQGNDPDGWFGQKTCQKLQGTSTTSNEATGTATGKQKNYIISDFSSIPNISIDLEGLSYECTVKTIYTDDKFSHIRKLQKTEFIYKLGGDEILRHIGYVNEIKVSYEDELSYIELQLTGYTEFLNQTIEIQSDVTDTRVNLLKKFIEEGGLKSNIDFSHLVNDTYTIKAQKTETTGTGGDLTQINGNDCTGAMQTNQLSAYSFDIDKCGGNTKIGKSSANYAVDTKGMSAKDAVMDVYHRFKYGISLTSKKKYNDNRRCPQDMWQKTGKMYGNCADVSRLVKCVGEVHGLKVGIRHVPGHYYNLIEVDGKVYRFDCCFQSEGTVYSGGEVCNNLSRRGGPWQ